MKKSSFSDISRWLVTADVHIYDYAQHNFTPNFRLEQFDRLADRMVHAAKEEGAGGFIIAGDLIQVPVVKPHIQHAVWSFVKKLRDHGPVLITLGNHDCDSKSDHIDTSTSIVTLLNDLDNVYLLNKEVYDICGLKVGFQSWLPNHDLDWFEGKIDILINHYTDVGAGWTGQPIDNTRYGMMYFGDIHKSYVTDNKVSIGNPIGHRLGDQADGTLMILDLKSTDLEHSFQDPPHSFKWIDTIIPDQFDFLRMYRPDKLPVNAGQYKYDVEVPYSIGTSNVTNDMELVSSIDVPAVVKTYSDELGLSGIHDQVLDRYKLSGYASSQVSLKFNLISMEVNNYRSIDNFELSFLGGVTLIAGSQGSGKTTIINALEYALRGNARISSQIRRNTYDLSVDLILEYLGTYYRIYRGNGVLKFWEGDEDQVRIQSYYESNHENYFPNVPFNNMRDCHAYLWSKLAFLDHWDVMYINQMSVGLFASMSQQERIDMLSKLMGWDTVTHYNDIIKEIISETSENVNTLSDEIKSLQSKISAVESLGIEVDPTDYDSLIKEKESEIRDASSFLGIAVELERKAEAIATITGSIPKALECPKIPEELLEISDDPAVTKEFIDNLESGYLAGLTSELSNKELLITSYETDLRNHRDDVRTTQELINKYKREIVSNEEIDKQIAEKGAQVQQLKTEIDSCTHLLEHSEGSDSTCDKCHQKLMTPEATESYKMNIRKTLESLNAKLQACQQSIVKLAMSKLDTTSHLDNISTSESSIVKLDSSIEVLVAEIAKVNAERAKLKDEYNKLSNLVRIYNTYNKSAADYVANKKLIDSQLEVVNKLDTEYNTAYAEYSSNTPYPEPSSSLRAHIANLVNDINQYKIKIVEGENVKVRKSNIQNYLSEIDRINAEVDKVNSSISELQKYNDLTNKNGVVVRSILVKCAELLSNGDLVVTTTKELASGDLAPDLSLSMRVKNELINYDNLSGGQLFMTDIRFILSLIEVAGGVGVLILDEGFKYFSPEHIDIIAAEIKQCSARDVLIITHAENYPLCDRVIRATMDDDGISQYSIYNTH